MKATAHAQRLGGEGSVEGLRAILESGNQWRLHDYAYGFSHARRPLSPELEALMAAHFSQRAFRDSFLKMIAEGGSFYSSAGLYSALLGLLDEVLADKGHPYRATRVEHVLKAIVRTHLAGTEQPLVERLASLPQTDPGAPPRHFAFSNQDRVVEFLARRRYAPAIPQLAARMLACPVRAEEHRGEPGKLFSAIARIDEAAAVRPALERFERLAHEPYSAGLSDEMHVAFVFVRRHGVAFTNERIAALLQGKPPGDVFASALVATLATREDGKAIDLALQRLEWVARHAPRATLELEVALEAFAKMQDPSLVDASRLGGILPAQSSERAARAHIALAERTGDPRAVAALAAHVPHPAQGAKALEMLLDLDAPAAWRDARQRLDAVPAGANAGWHREAARKLDAALADPAKHVAGRKEVRLARAFARDRDKLNALRGEAWIEAAEAVAARYAGLPQVEGLHGEIAEACVRLASEERFGKRRPLRAIALYGKSGAQGDARKGWSRGFRAALLIADTYQFDLRSPNEARHYYESALAQLATAPDLPGLEKGSLGWWHRWLTHEVAFLRTGAVYKGPVSQDDALYVLTAGVLFAGSHHLFSEPKASGLTGNEPASRITLARSIAPLSRMRRPEDILRTLERQDPSGYWSACILASVPYFDHMAQHADERTREALQHMMPGLFAQPAAQSGMRAASARFLRERGIQVSLRELDRRKATPEGTWNLLIESLKQADLESAYACLTPDMKRRFEPVWSRMPRDSLKGLADSFSGFALTGSSDAVFREALVRRGERAGFVYFQRVLGEWKIAEM